MYISAQFGTCSPTAHYCFGRLPQYLLEDETHLLAVDSVGNKFRYCKGALAWYGKITWESAHAWILIILYYLIVWGITLIFMVRLSFYAIYDVMNDITIIP